MKSVLYRSYGGPEVLEVGDVDEPKMGPDWVTITVRAASVNPVDWKVAGGGLDAALDTYFPVTPGWDVSGVVEDVGPAVQSLVPGDEVYGYVRKDSVHGGTYAQKVAAPIRTVSRKPVSLSFEEAAAIPLAGLTAYQAIVHHLGIGAGESVLVHAASGGVGSFAVQIAVARGARVFGTASEANHDYLRALGAEPLTYGPDLDERLHAVMPDGVDAVVDLVGGDTLAYSHDLLSGQSDGRIVSIADPDVRASGGSYLFVQPDADDLDALTRLVDDGKLGVEIAATYRLEEAGRAWQDSMGGHTRGKIVIAVE